MNLPINNDYDVVGPIYSRPGDTILCKCDHCSVMVDEDTIKVVDGYKCCPDCFEMELEYAKQNAE